MQKSRTVLKLDITKRIITDPKQIRKYDEEFNYNFYRPKSEHAWIDTELVLGKYLVNSMQMLGTALKPIYVAVNDKDDNIDDPVLRVHGRILDGTQRHASTKDTGTRWPVVYVFIKDYEDFILLWASINISKSKDVEIEQNKTIVRNYCNLIWLKKPKEIFDKHNIPQKSLVSAYVKEHLNLNKSESTIGRYIPHEFKDESHIRTGPRKEHDKSTLKKQSQVKLLENQVAGLLLRAVELEQRALPKDKKDQLIQQKEVLIRRLKDVNGSIKLELKKLRLKTGIDETDKDFEMFWSNYELKSELYNT